MAFLMHKNDDGHVPPYEKHPCSAITPKRGMAMTMTGGKLAIATGTTAPSYICVEEHGSAVSADTLVTVYRVDHSMIFETTNSAALTSVKCGEKVTLHASNGMQVTATTTSGVAEIVHMDGTAAGSRVFVRF